MSHRRKPKSSSTPKQRKREKRETKRAQSRFIETYREHPKSVILMSVLMALLLVFVVYGARNASPFDYVQCSQSAPLQQHTHFRLLIQIGERFGSINLLFVRIPENLGIKSSCMWPMHTHGDTPGERTYYYTTIHIESSYSTSEHRYTLGEFFEVWGESLGYPRALYFAPDGVSYYRSASMDVWARYGPVIDPATETYSQSVRITDFQNYAPADGDVIEIILHEPYTSVDCPYSPYTDAKGPGCGAA